MPRPAPVTTATRPSKLCSFTRSPSSVAVPTSHYTFGLSTVGADAAVPQPDDEPQRSEKWKARRDVIVDTSAPVFARQGYHATGIAELCTVNGLGKGAFYHYIESKEELLAAIHDRVMDEVMLGADRVAEAGGSPSAQLAMLGDELLDVIHRYPDHVWVFLHEFPALTAERAEQFRVRRREYERRVEAVLQAGIDSGEFRDVDPRLTALAWLGMHNYTYLWLKAGGRVSARDVAKPFADIFIRGIANAAQARELAAPALEPEEPAERAADQGGALVGGKVAELLRDQLPAPAERAFGVRVVVAPHDRRQAGDVPARDRDRDRPGTTRGTGAARTRSASAGTATCRSGGTAAPCPAGRRRGGCRPSSRATSRRPGRCR